MTPSSETEIFFGGGSDGKVLAPGIVVICSMNKNANFGPNLVVFGQKILFFTGEISVSELAVIFWGSPLFLAVFG